LVVTKTDGVIVDKRENSACALKLIIAIIDSLVLTKTDEVIVDKKENSAYALTIDYCDHHSSAPPALSLRLECNRKYHLTLYVATIERQLNSNMIV